MKIRLKIIELGEPAFDSSEWGEFCTGRISYPTGDYSDFSSRGFCLEVADEEEAIAVILKYGLKVFDENDNAIR